ncbi:MAG TPA: class II aldolase/adducin family protein [Gammaproteobacteria bacterium]|nr:class II aldolase/adducin family protein [Gammaproteobacteria bacterium]
MALSTLRSLLPCLALAALGLGASSANAQSGPRSAGPADPSLIQDLIAANRTLARYGIVDAYGHVSVRHDKDPNRFLMAGARAPELVSEADIIEYDLDAVPVSLNGRSQYSERYIHAMIYKARPDVTSVVHNHSPSVIPFGVSSVPIKPVYHMAGFIGEGLPIYDIREVSGMTEMLVNSAERGSALAAELGDGPAVLMRGHGVAVVGPDLKHAVGRSIYLEVNASIQLQAIALGGDVAYLSPDEAAMVVATGENQGYTRPWELWKTHALATR